MKINKIYKNIRIMAKTLVLCIDRDNDLGRKTHTHGPVMGIENNIKAAENLALSDPTDSDVNAIFSAVKVAMDMHYEVATITGDKDAGIIADRMLCDQVDFLISEIKPDDVVLVTDGAEDEQIIPIIESRIKISSVKRVIVKQSKELEGAYFTLTNFLDELLKEPANSRLMVGLPGIILLLFAIGILTDQLLSALALMLGITGIYLIIKGFGVEERFFAMISEFLKSLSPERISFLTYLTSVMILFIGLWNGWHAYITVASEELFVNISAFIKASADLVLLAAAFALGGRMIDEYIEKNYLSIRRNLIILALVILIKEIVVSGANFISPEEDAEVINMAISVILYILLFVVVIEFTKQIFANEILADTKLRKKLLKQRVFNTTGKHLGNVSDIWIRGTKLAGLKIGRRKITEDKIVSIGDIIVVKV